MDKLKKVYFCFVFLLTFALLIIHLFSLFNIAVDIFTVYLVLILVALPFLTNMKKLKWGDWEADFSDEVNKVTKEVDQLMLKKEHLEKKDLEELQKEKDALFSLLDSDPILALAKLRIELEKVIRRIYEQLGLESNRISSRVMPLGIMLHDLEKTQLKKEVLHNLKEVLSLCNKAIHGENVRAEDAYNITLTGIKLLGYLRGVSSTLESKRKPKT